MLLADQDRGLWDRRLIAEGQAMVRTCLQRNDPGRLPDPGGDQRRARDAPVGDDTDWRQIVALYDQLMALSPTRSWR